MRFCLTASPRRGALKLYYLYLTVSLPLISTQHEERWNWFFKVRVLRPWFYF